MATETAEPGNRPTVTLGVAQLGLAALFVTALVAAQVTASKVVAVELPTSLPLTGDLITVPAAVFAYAITFFASDCYTELYGKRAAQVLVNAAFAMNFLVLALVWSTILAPAAPSSIDPGAFELVLGASTNIVAGSLLAYVVSQNFDVIVFHAIKERTGGERLWLRNVVSTGASQLLDTVIFVGIAFWAMPALFGVGPQLPGAVVVSLMVGQYLLKLLIAVLDTPFVYLITGAVRRSEATSE